MTIVWREDSVVQAVPYRAMGGAVDAMGVTFGSTCALKKRKLAIGFEAHGRQRERVKRSLLVI
jgi:hypothetical protein